VAIFVKNRELAVVLDCSLCSRVFEERSDKRETPYGSTDPDTGDIYSGLDRFGRIKDCRWILAAGPTDVSREKYGYDRASNRLWRENTVATAQSKAFDELYEYDGLYRLHEMGRGTLNGGHTALTNLSFAQCFSLDETGNWFGFRTDGNGTWDTVQERTANETNQITGLTPPTSPAGCHDGLHLHSFHPPHHRNRLRTETIEFRSADFI